MAGRPQIGVTSWHHPDDEEQWEYIRDNYTRAVRAAGGLPFILPIVHDDPGLIDEYLGALDGILLTGGEDIHPSFYGEMVIERCGQIDERRDRFEIELCRRALALDLPVLGICRGCQVVNVALGGSLYQDLTYRPGTSPEHDAGKARRGEVVHEVTVEPGTGLHGILGCERLGVTSSHHQLLRKVPPGLRVNALAPDGTIEGVEGPLSRFLLAVQWHPERLVEKDPAHLALFEALVTASARVGHGKDTARS